jgi:anti-sigma B factor antagonist
MYPTRASTAIRGTLSEDEDRETVFRASVHEMYGVSVVEAEGGLNLSATDRFGAAIPEAAKIANGKLVVDLTAVTFMDSSGLHAPLNAARRFRESVREVAHSVSEEPIGELTRVAEIDELLVVYPDAKAASKRREGRNLSTVEAGYEPINASRPQTLRWRTETGRGWTCTVEIL